MIEVAQAENEALNHLTEVSPFLSKTAYITAVESNLFSSESLESLLNLNPVLATSNSVKVALEQADGVDLTSDWLTEINALLLEDPRFVMEGDIHRMGMKLMDQNKTAIHAVYRDTMGYSLAALNDARMHLLDPAQYYSAVFARFNQGQEEAWTMLENMPNEFRLSVAQEEEWLTIQQYLAFLENVDNSERNLKQLTEDEIGELVAISEIENGGSASGWASNALCFHYGICKLATATDAPDLIVDASPKANNTEQSEALKETSFRIVPNPTSNEANVMAVDARNKTQSISVFDINGRRILFQRGANHQRFNTSSLTNGIYFCRIFTLMGEVENIKFIVNH